MSASPRLRSYLVAGVAVLAAAVLWWTFSRTPHVVAKPVMAAAPAPKEAPAVATASMPVASAGIAGLSATPAKELAATARMYAAHESLRAPEVANPDSSTNRQILQTMVAKALARNAGASSQP